MSYCGLYVQVADVLEWTDIRFNEGMFSVLGRLYCMNVEEGRGATGARCQLPTTFLGAHIVHTT